MDLGAGITIILFVYCCSKIENFCKIFSKIIRNLLGIFLNLLKICLAICEVLPKFVQNRFSYSVLLSFFLIFVKCSRRLNFQNFAKIFLRIFQKLSHYLRSAGRICSKSILWRSAAQIFSDFAKIFPVGKIYRILQKFFWISFLPKIAQEPDNP